MADKWLVKSGNTSDPTVWNDGTLPGATDDCYADGYTGTIDADLTVASVRTTQRTGGTAGGGWVLAGGVTLTADVRPYTSDCVLFSADSPAESTIVGTIYTASGTNYAGVRHIGSGTLYCVGSITWAYNNGTGVVLTGTGILDFTGSVAGIQNAGIWGIRLNGSGTARVTGEVYSNGISIEGGSGQLQITGSVASSDSRVINIGSSSAVSVTITGAVSGGVKVNEPSIRNQGAGPIIVIGDVAAGTAQGAHGIHNTHATSYIGVDGNLIAGTGGGLGVTPICSQNLAIINPTHHSTQYAGGSADAPVYDGNIYTQYGILATDSTSGQPAESDVRKDTVYGPSGELTGTLAVPPASAVGVGVPVDNTIGTAAVTTAAIQAALTSQGLTEARAGYLDKLNVEGDIANTSNASSFKATGFAVPGSAMTLTSDERNAVADTVLSRDVANAEASAAEHSLCTIVLASLESSINGTTWTIKRTDGETTHAIKTLTTDKTADPITGVS